MTISEIDREIRQKEFEIELCEINAKYDPETYYSPIGYYHNHQRKRNLESELELLQNHKKLMIKCDNFIKLCDQTIEAEKRTAHELEQFLKNH